MRETPTISLRQKFRSEGQKPIQATAHMGWLTEVNQDPLSRPPFSPLAPNFPSIEKTFSNEASHRTSNALFFTPHDRGMRNGNAHGMTKERSDREPISESSHHRSLRKGAQPGKNRSIVLEGSGKKVKNSHQDKESRCEPTHF